MERQDKRATDHDRPGRYRRRRRQWNEFAGLQLQRDKGGAWGRYLYDVLKNFGVLEPLPPCPHLGPIYAVLNPCNLPYYV